MQVIYNNLRGSHKNLKLLLSYFTVSNLLQKVMSLKYATILKRCPVDRALI